MVVYQVSRHGSERHTRGKRVRASGDKEAADLIETLFLASLRVPPSSAGTDELVRQLRQKAGWRDDVHGDLHRAAADEIEHLEEMVRDWIGAAELASERAIRAEALSAAPPQEALNPDVFRRLLRTAQLLQQNSEGCAVNHHGLDFEQQGLPGWLADTQRAIDEATLALSRPQSPTTTGSDENA
jgi:hypothetical protein